MFEQSLIMDGARKSNPWSFAASITVQSVLLAAALALPLMHIAKIDTRLADVVYLPRQLGRPEPVRQTATRGSATSTLSATRTYRPFQAPSRIPTHVATGPDLPDAPMYAFTGSGAGDTKGVDLGPLPDLGQKLLPPAPPPNPPHHAPQPVTESGPMHVSEGVQAAKLVFGPKPAYPPLAKQARISGTVRLMAQIAADGRIQDLRVISGHPMLISAAIDAVRRWVYKPTLLNGKPVVVLTDIQVNFVLNQ